MPHSATVSARPADINPALGTQNEQEEQTQKCHPSAFPLVKSHRVAGKGLSYRQLRPGLVSV